MRPLNNLTRIAGEQRSRALLWMPVGLMAGISVYFTLPDEPPLWAGAAALAASFVLLALLWRFALRLLPIALLIIALGFTAAQWRAVRVATPLLTHEFYNVDVEGTIDDIEPVEQKEKLVLSHLIIDGLPQAQTPKRVRVSFRAQDPLLQSGDRVHLRANLYPLPSPIMPGSYDFARHFYFRTIGGNGYAMRPAERIETHPTSSLREWLGNLRHAIGEDMRARMPGAVGTVAAAMTVGETGPIPAEVKSSLRDSGLAHMLAIAGLHLGIVTGIIFFNIRLLLTLTPALALRLPTKKIAAIFALTGAYIYLSLAGYPIPAERAFIMVAFLFTAVLLDRRGITLRTLSMAATVILLLFPESLFGASFQMSFAATLAIVALYENFGHSLTRPGSAWHRHVMTHGIGIVATSLVATLATAPFVLYHFNRFALLGLLANMVVVPLATFVIMPGMVLALLLMPLGLQWIGYISMGWGTAIMMSMAAWVTGLPHASLHLPSPTDMGLAISAFGLLWLCLVAHRIRLLGLLLIMIGMSTILLHRPVDVLISNDAHQVIVRLDNGHYAALRGTERSFTIQNWLRTEGEDDLVPLEGSGATCDDTACHYRGIILVKKPDDDALAKACAEPAALLIAWKYLNPENCPGPQIRIGRSELETHGAYAGRFSPLGLRVAYTRESAAARRLWQPNLLRDDNDEY